MNKFFSLLVFVLFATELSAAELSATELSARTEASGYAYRVNTLIGTEGVGLASGYLYPGATYPYGMVQFTPSYFSKRSGFVINQLSGAGCEHQGNFPTFPMKGRLSKSPNNILDCRINIAGEKGHAGYYEAMVQEDIKAQLTVTERTGMARYEYPTNERTGTVIIGGGIAATPTEQAAIAITAPNRCEGYAEGGYFCGIRTPYKVYFVAEFDADATETGTWKGERLTPNATFAEGEYSGVYFTFDLSRKKSILYKIGVSYVSVENARANLKAENAGWSFAQVRQQAEARWNECLGKMEVEGDNADRITQFYTHLYRAFIHPNVCSDVNGEYMGADFKVHRSPAKQYTSFSNWDTYRTQIQLLSILDPEVVSDIVVSLREFAEQSGGSFPRWVMANIETGVMQGDPTPILIANAYAFGARNYDPKPLFKIMRKGAEEPGAKSQNEETRPGLKQYLEKGYYNASIQLEYTSADYAIGQFALHAVGDEFASWRYFHFARSWRNLYNPATGWLQSRYPDGSWKPLSEDFRESTYKNYFWMPSYDLDGLVEIIGGRANAEKRLDEFFARLDAGYGDAWFASGNEPSFHIPWIYNWIGRPYKTQQVVNRILNEQYSSRIDGLPGNDDLGTMGAWYVFACIGLYPEIPGVGGFTINTPIFASVKIHLKKGDIVIKGGSEKNIYIRSMKLDGKPYDRTWIDWKLLENGATIEYTTSDKPNTCPDWAWADFRRPEHANPIISPDASSLFYCPMRRDSVAWEASDTFNPAAAICDGKVVVLYRAEDNSAVGIGARTSRVGYASSDDGLHFARMKTPVLYPADDTQKALEWTGGCEDPRVAMTEDGLYVMFYTQWNRKQARLAVATSRNLKQWEKHGPAFAKAYNGRFFDMFSKSASIVTKLVDGKQVIARIGGKYLMYWGEKFVNVATSTDLVNWQPMLDEQGELLRVMKPRKGRFDSELTECGPPAVLTDKGILLLYNGKNRAGVEGDMNYTANSYCAGQALFDAHNPTKLIDRLDKPFFVPEADFERSGQYPAGTVFIEGLVHHRGQWFLYYGCADSRVAVAVYNPSNP